jgi:hypothetical protein
MKLWKANRLDQEWELNNEEIAKRWVKYEKARFENLNPSPPLTHFLTGTNLVYFISSKDGLNSSWDWDQCKGSIQGSKDMLEILDIANKKLV